MLFPDPVAPVRNPRSSNRIADDALEAGGPGEADDAAGVDVPGSPGSGDDEGGAVGSETSEVVDEVGEALIELVVGELEPLVDTGLNLRPEKRHGRPQDQGGHPTALGAHQVLDDGRQLLPDLGQLLP